jgi:hypothetical protein
MQASWTFVGIAHELWNETSHDEDNISKVGANGITQATPTCFLTIFVIIFWYIFLEYSWKYFWKKSSKSLKI